tara:strand:+ start:483 stop:812 length:330 start_codon:yes stop_codon:yes gene_type:complete
MNRDNLLDEATQVRRWWHLGTHGFFCHTDHRLMLNSQRGVAWSGILAASLVGWGIKLWDFASQDADIAWRIDTDAYRVPFDLEDGDGDIVANTDLLLKLSGEYEHGSLL